MKVLLIVLGVLVVLSVLSRIGKKNAAQNPPAQKPPEPHKPFSIPEGVEIRVQMPTGETGTIVHAGPDGTSYISYDPKPGEEDRRMFSGDPKKTQIVFDLLNVPPNQRDEAWRKAFLDNVADVNFCVDSELPIEGPDGFPYLPLSTPEEGKPYTAFVIRHILPNLLEQGCGVVINLKKGEPDWVFSYGDMVCYQVYGAFSVQDERFEARDSEPPQSGEEMGFGEPSPQLLPPPVRATLGRFLRAYEFPAKVFLLSRKPNPEAGRKGGLSLVFPISAETDTESEISGYVCRALPWFLPRHYSVLWMQESESFIDL